MVAILKHVGTADWDGQLVCACSEDAARDAFWAGSLARVNAFKCLTHVGDGGGEPTVLGSGLCRWHCVILKAGKEHVKLVQKPDVGGRNVAGFPFVVRDCL